MAALRSWTPEMLAWLDARYGTTDIHELTRELNATFGCDKSETALYVKANQRGLHRPKDSDRRKRAERVVRWSKEPEMTAFMVENDNGSIPSIIEKFRDRFGITLTGTQVSAFRTAHGTQSKRGRTTAQDWHRRPVGYERDTGKGYTLVKVREDAEVPGSKDNWVPKHVLVWERTRGLRLPDGWLVLFCDGDHSNLDPSNLKAVPRDLIGIMNGGPAWSDRATLEAAIATAMLVKATAEANLRPRKCGVCGKTFTPDIRSTKRGVQQRTCRECLDKGLRAPKDYGWITCPTCGSRVRRRSASQRYCSPACCEKACRERRRGVAK